MNRCGRSRSCGECCSTNENLTKLTEINRLWKHEYDLLKTKYLREKGALQEENKVLRAEVTTLKTKLERSSKNVHEDTSHDNFLSHENKRQELCNRNHNVEELMKEQLAAYREDFKLEHEDKAKIESEKNSLQERLTQCEQRFQALHKELDVYKQECKRLQELHGKSKDIKRYPSIDRSKSYPETSLLSYEDDLVDPMSTIALPPSMCSKREGYLAFRDFRTEQLKRGILVRNPSHGKTQASTNYSNISPNRRSDSSPHLR